MEILRRHLKDFGVDLVWDGKKVISCQRSKRKINVLEEYEATTLQTATKIMRDLEDQYHAACTAMC